MSDKIENERRQVLRNCRRMVVKAGTRLLTDPELIPQLISGIHVLREKGYKVLLVSSGAVGTGMKQLQMKKRPRKLSQVQALAAIGQCHLMAMYDEACRTFGFHSAQLLLTAGDVHERERHLNIMNCIEALWDCGTLPIINENDSVSVSELKFGDNDILSAMLATMTRAELTVILTTEEGLRVRNADGSLGERVSVVNKITDELKESARGTDNREFSIGGMISKLRAAEMLTGAGEHLWIADGRIPGILREIADGKDVGTLFVPARKQMVSRKRWIRFFAHCSGRLIIDDGAVEALRSKGRSLLPSGVKAVEGTFKRGDTLEIADSKGTVIARGLTNFDSDECARLAGCQCKDISQILRRAADEEIIHRDNLVAAG